MLKFLKKHPPKEGEERERLKKDLFKFQKCIDHGFPSKPSAVAYDPKLKLLAIGTKTGALHIYGSPGFEVSAVHEGDVSVSSLVFIPDEGYIVSACSDNSLHSGKLITEMVLVYWKRESLMLQNRSK
uniref:Lethal giant larvae (Lgl)-like C-terminal domain-containing protein n=1 Tax=Arion vulgaris TaxID=1028688 RepID=A0A0B7B939_9EUPU